MPLALGPRSASAVVTASLLAGCATASPTPPPLPPRSGVVVGPHSPWEFGTVAGQTVQLFPLKNAKGIEVQVTNYGGIITSIKTPDRAGRLADIVLGYDSLAGYLRDSPYFGAIVGRYANRIARGKFTLDGKTYTLAVNNGPNSLHGGVRGFDKVVWTAEALKDHDG